MEFGILKKADGTAETIHISDTWKCVFDGKAADDVVFQDFQYSFSCDYRILHTAIMTNTLAAPEAGIVRAGASADWYFEFKVNGTTIKSTMSGGNGTCEHRRSAHILEFPVRKGMNEIEVKLQNGMGDMLFMIGPEQPPVKRISRKISMEEARAAFERLGKTSCRNLTPQRLEDMQTLQCSLDDFSARDFAEFYADPDAPENTPAKYWYAAAFRKVLEELKTEKVEGKKVVLWYVYNMGLIVKTSTSAFAIDLFHKFAPLAEPYLDFCLVTHNHRDHCDARFIKAMQSKGLIQGKPVISSFLPSCYFSKYPATWKIKDITIHTGESDHNVYLKNFVTPVEIICGEDPDSCVIFHSGDSCNPQQFKPTRPVDLMFIHPAPCGLSKHVTEQTARIIRPESLFLCHLHEIGHGFGPGCWTFEHAIEEAARVRPPVHPAIPVWGEKIVWSPDKDRNK